MGDEWHDAAHWDDRYRRARRPGPAPDSMLITLVERIPMPGGASGRALDLGCGEGRHSVWLADRGWQVTAVDFSAVAIDRARSTAAASGVIVDWRLADLSRWLADAERASQRTAYDLVVLAHVRLGEDDLARVRALLNPGGHLLMLSHGQGGKGPRSSRFRATPEAMRARAGCLDVRVCEETWETAADGERTSRLALLARRRGATPG